MMLLVLALLAGILLVDIAVQLFRHQRAEQRERDRRRDAVAMRRAIRHLDR